MFLVERSDFLHFFCCFILNENIKKFIFSNTGTANRFVVKPQVRHLIDCCFDRSQNILLKIRKYRILFSNSFFSAKFWLGITVAFALAFSLVSVDFIFRWHGKHSFEFFHVKHLEFVSLQSIILFREFTPHFFRYRFKDNSICVSVIPIAIIIRQNNLVDTHRIGALHH